MLTPVDLFAPDLTEINRLASRPPLEPLPDADAARAGDASPWRRTLDGEWRFRLVASPDEAPERWMMPATGDATWRSLTVPGCWTRQDTGDLPHYTNVIMAWTGEDPGYVPVGNPTGLHRRRFTVPRAWRGRQIVVHLGGVESLAAVWCNGAFIGMGKDSRLPSEFDVTDHIVPGENLLAVLVPRWSDATWIEDQDHWWHGGIHRSCFLEARGRHRIEDLVIDADFDRAGARGELTVRATVVGATAGSHRVRCTLETLSGRRIGPVLTADVPVADYSTLVAEIVSAHVDRGPVAYLRAGDLKVDPWSAELPRRYRVVTELLDAEGAVVEAHSTMTGFRRVEVRDRRLLVNGTPIVVHGVNRHDHHPVTGKTVTGDEMRDELLSMKAHNINAVRTAHYPNDHRLLDLCDELGLYVIDEANVESHARQSTLTQDRIWSKAVTERIQRMVVRDRNHPCIIGWSLGNESGHAPVHDAAAAWIRATDPTRFVHYEGSSGPRWMSDRAPWVDGRPPASSDRVASDVVCPMYPEHARVVRWARWAEASGLDDRPMLICEYSHAMGNSNGSLVDYVDSFHAEPALAGGFVWDWRDQGLDEHDDEGRPYWAFGGHFGDEPNDANFCINGLVGPDGTPHPALREYTWACRPVRTDHLGGRRIRVHNRRHFTGIDDLELRWSVLHDGVEAASGRTRVEVGPGRSTMVTLPASVRPPSRGEGHLTVRWVQRRRTPWAPRGHEVAWDQFVLSDEAATPRPTSSKPVAVELEADGIGGISIAGEPVVLGDISGCLWRAPIDNDGIKAGWTVELGSRRIDWERQGIDRLTSVLDGVRQTTRAGVETIVLERRLVGTEAEAIHTTRIRVADGVARFDERIDLPDVWADLPRVGVRFEVPASLARLDWFGLGPDETYPDRAGAATVGRWRSSVAEQYHPYVVPQEHGTHAETRWFSLSAGRTGLRVDAVGRPLLFAARRHHDTDLTAAATVADLTPSDTIEVHVDAAMRGLGTDICGPDALPEFRLAAGTHRWSWSLSGLGW